jgi:hypothetical protein
MKKIDELLKKAELFEKLAIYGDRKSFLRAIAEEVDQKNSEAASSKEDSKIE